MIKKCKQCGKEFEAVRITALYCSSHCRKLAFQKEVSVPEVSVPEKKEVSVLSEQSKENNPEQTPYYSDGGKKEKTFKQVEWSGKTIPNNPTLSLCKGCQKPVHHLVDICSECVGKKITREQLNLPDVKHTQISDKIPKQMNWQRLGLKQDEVKAYIIWSLKKAGILDHSVITIGNKIFGNYKQQAKLLTGNVDEFRKDMKQPLTVS